MYALLWRFVHNFILVSSHGIASNTLLQFSIRAATADLDMVERLCYVSTRMEWYMLLHTLLLDTGPSNTSAHDSHRIELRIRLKKTIQELY